MTIDGFQLDLSCLCGRVHVALAARPDFIHECNCALCRKTGARWAYPHPDAVRVDGATHGFRRGDKNNPAAEVHFCPACGATTHFVLTESTNAAFGNGVMGVNLRLADEAELAGIELRYPDGRAWDGAGEFAYYGEARVL